MPGRYEMVEEPEALEVADDEVYNPNQSVREINSSLRSLEPIIAGPITLKTIFYDPRWSLNQRRICLSVLVFLVLLCLSLMIALFAGLGKVIQFIQYTEHIRTRGLYMFPPPTDSPSMIALKYCAQPEKCNATTLAYAKSIQATLESYQRAQADETKYEDCGEKRKPSSPNRLCRFPLASLGENCTKANHFGWLSGNPCVLLQFRNVDKWSPKITSAFLKNNKRFKMKGSRPFNDTNFMPVICTERFPYGQQQLADILYYPPDGFDLRFFPQNLNASNGEHILGPLVMIQLMKANAQVNQFDYACSIYAENSDALHAIKELDFTLSPVAGSIDSLFVDEEADNL